MKRVILSLLIIRSFLGGIFQRTQAQDKTLELNINAVALSTYAIKKGMFTLGIGLDYHLEKILMISTEIQIWTNQLNTRSLQFNLGAILRLYQSADITDEFGFSGPKINAGSRIKS